MGTKHRTKGFFKYLQQKKTSEVLILSKRGKNDAYSGYEMLDPHAATAGGKNITGTSVSRFLPQHYVSQMQVNIQYKSHGSYGIDSTIVKFSKFTRTTILHLEAVVGKHRLTPF